MIQPARRVRRALLLSLTAHGLFVPALCCIPGPSLRAYGDAGVIEAGPDISLSVSEPPARTSCLPTGEEEQNAREEENRVVMREPAPAERDSAAVQAPIVVGAPSGQPFGKAHGIGSAGTGSGKGQPSLLDAPPSAQRVVYLIDRSLSMGPSGALVRARQELLTSIGRLRPGTSFQVIFYNRHPRELCIQNHSGYLNADESMREAVARELAQFPAMGTTDHLAALLAGLRLRPDVVFLVTDAGDLNERQVHEVTRLNAGRTVIHAIELRRGKEANSLLSRLAADNGGTYRRVSPDE